MVITLSELNERLVVPAASSSYPELGATYRQDSYEIKYANQLVRTDRNYYNSMDQIPEGQRISTAGEELALQMPYEIVSRILERVKDKREIIGKDVKTARDVLATYAVSESEKAAIQYVFDAEQESIQKQLAGGKLIIDPRNAKVFDDLFARGPDKIYMWQHTETFLRIPHGKQNPGKPDFFDHQGRKYWVREFGNGNEVSGAVCVPEGNGRVAPKTSDLLEVYDPITGLPRVTSDNPNDREYGNHTTHFWFNSTPDLDSTSGHYDIAVVRRCDWHRDGRCLYVGAVYERWGADSGGGFRLVRGSSPKSPKIKRELVEKPVVETPAAEIVQQLDPAQIEQAFLKRIRTDYRSIPHPDFLNKYDL